jgi:hypothetical protein
MEGHDPQGALLFTNLYLILFIKSALVRKLVGEPSSLAAFEGFSNEHCTTPMTRIDDWVRNLVLWVIDGG